MIHPPPLKRGVVSYRSETNGEVRSAGAECCGTLDKFVMESRKSERAQPVVVARHTGGPGAAGAESFTLANGMQVIVREDHFAPVVALQAWVKVGAADEPDEEAGVAHVHEHMLF